MSILPGTQLGRYEVLSPLGAGGMGEVYLALDRQLGRKLALKFLPADLIGDQDRLRRFEQEARAASALNHPAILTIYEFGSIDGRRFIATEYVEGDTLRQTLSNACLRLPDALETAMQVLGAIEAAHGAGIVHRDIKPENIMLRPDGYVKVLDFGLAKLTETSSARISTESPTLFKAETNPGMIVGTPHYMSPEQARGLQVDSRTDLFSIGIVLYEMLTGTLPFAGETVADVIAAMLHLPPPPLARYFPKAPPELEACVLKALEKDRGNRYQTAGEFQYDLKRLRLRLEYEALVERGDSTGNLVGRMPSSEVVTLELDSKDVAKKSSGSASGTRPTRRRKMIDSLAVLPFATSGTDSELEYLAEGVTENLINALSRVGKLRVVPRSTVFRYKGTDHDPMEVGGKLNVRAVLTGRVAAVGGHLVVKTELIDIERESQVWGEQYRRRMTDIFALQEEISEEIGERLQLKLTGGERRQLVKRYTENTEAYHLYLKGRYYSNKRTESWLRKGIEHFQQAIDLDPNYALAHAGIADAYGFLASSTGGRPPREAYPKAKVAALKAIDLDEHLAEAHTSLGFYYLMYEWNLSAAEREFKRALDLNPNYANAHDGYGFYLKAVGRHDEAVRQCLHVQKLDPLSVFSNISLGWAYYFARRFDDAIEQCLKSVEMDPRCGFALWNIGLSWAQKGRLDEAVAALGNAVQCSDGLVTFRAHLGYVLGLAGKTAQARDVLAGLDETARESYVSAYYFAIVHLGLGDLDQAFVWLGRAHEERAGFLAFLNVEPMFDRVRNDERFRRLLEAVGLPVYQSGL